jgi:hypothetical protein
VSKEDIIKKWAPIMDSMGVTGSKADWMSQYTEMHSNNESEIEENNTTYDFPSLLPIAMKIADRTISQDLVSVQPMDGPGGMSKEERERIEAEVKSENRDGKIDALIEGKDFKEIKPEDHPDWKKGGLFYMDYEYKFGYVNQFSPNSL